MELTIPMTIEEDNVMQLLCRGHEEITLNVCPPEVFEVCIMLWHSEFIVLVILVCREI